MPHLTFWRITRQKIFQIELLEKHLSLLKTYFRYEAEELVSSMGLGMVSTSAKDNINIGQVFQHIANSHFRTTINIPAATNYSPR